MEIMPRFRFEETTIYFQDDGLYIEQESNSSETAIIWIPKFFIPSFLELLDKVIKEGK